MIAVLGAGSWGTALAVTLARSSPKEKVLLWGRSSYFKYLTDTDLPNNIEFTNDVISVAQRSKDLLIAVPSYAFTDLIQKILPYIKTSRIAWATKGLDAKTGKFFSQVLFDLLGEDIAIAMLSGPSFAKEVIHGSTTLVVIASRSAQQDQIFVKDLITRLHSKIFRVYSSIDLVGVQLGGVLKNILAVASGICDGLKFGANTKAALITRGLAEGLRLVVPLGGQIQTLMGLSGVGDIFLSCTDQQSRNRRFGLLLADGFTVDQAKAQIGQAIEAADNIQQLYKLSVAHNIKMPIIYTMWQIIVNNVPLQQAIDYLLTIEEPQVEWI